MAALVYFSATGLLMVAAVSFVAAVFPDGWRGLMRRL